MLITLEDQILALLGSTGFICYMVVRYLKHRNSGATRMTERVYFKKHWLIHSLYVFIAQVLCAGKEYLFDMYVTLANRSDLIDDYVDSQGGISFLIGMFATGIFEKIFKLGSNYLTKER